MSAVDPTRVESVAQHLTLPAPLEPQRRELARQVVEAQGIVDRFATAHGWADRLRPYSFDSVEIHSTQAALWQRVLALHGLDASRPLPTKGLAAALEKRVLLAVSPAEFARVQPDYASKPGSYVRLLAHEIAHRLHVAILDGREQAMGPTWFFEGFAVVAAGDLDDLVLRDGAALEVAMRARGPGAYRKFGAAVRFLSALVPLTELVARAGAADFERWAQQVAARPPASRANSTSRSPAERR